MTPMTWRDGGLVGFALESTGPRVTDKVTGAALLTWKPEEKVLDVATWASDPLGVVDGLERAIKAHTPIVGHHVAQSLSILDANCRAHGVPTLVDRLGGHGEVRPIIDTWVIGVHVKPNLPHHSLEYLASAYGVRAEGTGVEDAARAAMRLAWALWGKHKEVQTDARTLHALERQWFGPQMARLAARLGKHGDIDTSLRWPVGPPVVPEPEPEGFQMAIPYEADPEEAAAVAALAAVFDVKLIGTVERIS